LYFGQSLFLGQSHGQAASMQMAGITRHLLHLLHLLCTSPTHAELLGSLHAASMQIPYINMHLLHLHLHSFHAASQQLLCCFLAVPHSGAPGGTISKHHLDTTWGTTSHNQLGHLLGTTWCSFHPASSQDLVCLACQGLLRGTRPDPGCVPIPRQTYTLHPSPE
jgi:hypothetical protein